MDGRATRQRRGLVAALISFVVGCHSNSIPSASTAAPASSPTPSLPASTTSDRHPNADDARVFFAYDRMWDTPIDDQAEVTLDGLLQTAPDFSAFDRAAPEGSVERARVERVLASYEQAGTLVRAGALSPDLYFDIWSDPAAEWKRVQPWVVGLRSARNEPNLYSGFEWLAGQTTGFWDARTKNPPHWTTWSTVGPPSTRDVLLFYEFAALWNTQTDVDAAALIARLTRDAPDYTTFRKLVPDGSAEAVLFDRYYCELDQAGVFAKNGLLRPDLLDTIHPAAESWRVGKAWIMGLRAEKQNPHIYENAEWLASQPSLP
jgi:hypothetical protein